MSEVGTLERLSQELNLDDWWIELLGQNASADLDLDLVEERLPRSEIRGAEEIHRKFGNTLSYTESRNQWYIWDERIHVPCEGEGITIKIVKIFYKAVTKALLYVQDDIASKAKKIEASGMGDAKENAAKKRKEYDTKFKKYRDFRDRLSTDAGISALVRMMRTECDVPSDYYDNDQRWFVMRNWVIDLDVLRKEKKISWLKHSPDRNVTKYINADYVHEKNLGYWDKFLHTSIPNDAMRGYLQLAIGAAFMGESGLRCILNLHGPPHTGKSVFVNTIFNLGKEGAGYAAMPDSKALTKVSGQNFEQENFRGRRAIIMSEPDDKEPVDDSFLKRFTGDSWVETRTLNKKSTGHVPQGVPIIASNKALKINTRDPAVVERVHMIEFPVRFTKDDPDPDKRLIVGLENLLLEDGSRVLQWIIMGMIEYVTNHGGPLDPPEEVKALSKEVVVEASTALRFVDDFISKGFFKVDDSAGEPFFITIDEAFMRYRSWIMMEGERREMPKRYFTEDISKKYFGVTTGKDPLLIGLVPTADYHEKYGMPTKAVLEGTTGLY